MGVHHHRLACTRMSSGTETTTGTNSNQVLALAAMQTNCRHLRPSCTPSTTTPQPNLSLLLCPPVPTLHCQPDPLRSADLLTSGA
eukprot:1591969-Prymnesium_polylepis.3